MEIKRVNYTFGPVDYLLHDGCIQSVLPANTHMNVMYWSGLVPPVKLQRVLLLGVGLGTVASLIKKIHGEDVEIHGVDIETTPQAIEFLTTQHKADFTEFVRKEPEGAYDGVIFDVYDGAEFPMVKFSESLKDFYRILKQDGLLLVNSIVDPYRDYTEEIWARVQKEGSLKMTTRYQSGHGNETLIFQRREAEKNIPMYVNPDDITT